MVEVVNTSVLIT